MKKFHSKSAVGSASTGTMNSWGQLVRSRVMGGTTAWWTIVGRFTGVFGNSAGGSAITHDATPSDAAIADSATAATAATSVSLLVLSEAMSHAETMTTRAQGATLRAGSNGVPARVRVLGAHREAHEVRELRQGATQVR